VSCSVAALVVFVCMLITTFGPSCDDPRDPMCINYGSHCSVLYILNKVAPYADRGMPGGWHDLDMLEVGHGGMTDDEYKAHFAMWAILKSPLLIGADLRTLSASALTILNNPAIIALSQDAGNFPPHRIAVDYNVKKDRFGVGETHVWANELFNGDQVVAFLNAADEDVEMSSSLEEIFVSDGPGGSSSKVSLSWDVYDLWASRMSNEVAGRLIKASNEKDGEALKHIHSEADWYNSTQIPYQEGLAQDNRKLFGERVRTVEAGGILSHKVRRHSAAVFRLRPVREEIGSSAEHDEL
jgi:alpha-galactosidase